MAEPAALTAGPGAAATAEASVENAKLARAAASCRPDEGEAPYGIFRM